MSVKSDVTLGEGCILTLNKYAHPSDGVDGELQ